MSVTVSIVRSQHSAASRPKLPFEPPSSSTGSSCVSSSSPRPSRLNVAATPTPQVLSSSHPTAADVSARPGNSFGEIRGKSVSIGYRKRILLMEQTTQSQRASMEVGLENLGNTCFMNSSLQCLLHIQPLVSYFLAIDIDREINSDSPMRGLLASSFAQLVRDVFNASARSSIAPLAFQKVIGHYAPHLLDNQQQDCQEFLRFLLDGMSEDLSRKRRVKRRSASCPDGLSPKLSSKRLLISSRTRDRVKESRMNPESTVLSSPEELRRNKIDSQSFERSESLADYRARGHQNGNNSSSMNDSGQCDEARGQRKYSSASKFREQVGLASRHGSPCCGERPLTTNGLIDEVTNTLAKISVSNSSLSNVSPVRKNEEVEKGKSKCREKNKEKLRVSPSSKKPREIFPEWFASRGTELKGEGTETQEEKSSADTESSVSIPPSEGEIKIATSFDSSLRCPDAEASGTCTPTSHRRRFKLPNLLGPITFTIRDRGDKTSKASSSAPSPPKPSNLPSPLTCSQPPSPLRAPSPMVLNSRSKKSSPTSCSSSCNTTGVFSDINFARSNDSNGIPLDKSLFWDPKSCEDKYEREKGKVAAEESEKAWLSYLDLNDSVVTDIFAGQLQSTIECLTCKNRSFCFDPFLDLSVPIPKRSETKSKWRRNFSSRDLSRCPLEECIEKFAGEEILDGENMYTCSKCCEKRKCTKKLSIFKYPRVLVIHIKRFRYSEVSREKISTDVIFPLKGLDLGPYLSTDRPTYVNKGDDTNSVNPNQTVDLSASLMTADVTNKDLKRRRHPQGDDPTSVPSPNQEYVGDDSPRYPENIPDGCSEPPFDARMFAPVYDLLGVSHHCGTLSGGHYVAHVDTNAHVDRRSSQQGDGKDVHIPAEGSHTSEPSDRSAASDSSETGMGRARQSGDPRWMCFNDEQVSPASPIDVIGPSAYVLFYRLREC